MSALISFVDPDEPNYKEKCYWWREYLSTRSDRSLSELSSLYWVMVDAFFYEKKIPISAPEYDDYWQACRIALCKAIITFKPDMGTKFTTWMYDILNTNPKNQRRDFKPTINLPNSVVDGREIYDGLCQKYFDEFSAWPTVEELAHYIEFDVSSLTQILARITAVECVSVDGTNSPDDCYDFTLEDFAPSVELGYSTVELRDLLKAIELTDTEKTILVYLFHGHKQSYIAEILKIKQPVVSRLKLKLSKKLRESGLNCDYFRKPEKTRSEYAITDFLDFGRKFLKMPDSMVEAEA